MSKKGVTLKTSKVIENGARVRVMVRVRVGKVRKPYPNFQMVPLSMTFTMSALLNLKKNNI